MSGFPIGETPPPVQVVVFMGRNDESVPLDRVAGRWREWERSGDLAPGSKFIEIPDGDHRLIASLEMIAEEIAVITAGKL
jgi:hypothetical protein